MEEQKFNLDDLVSFGNYLLSDSRIELITANHEDPAEYLQKVYDADIANWLGQRFNESK
jgi:hypothetical protein